MRGKFNPGKVVSNICYVGYYGKELTIKSFQVLTIQPCWYKVRGRTSKSLLNAAEGTGNMRVCRVYKYNQFIPGKLYMHRSGPVCYYGYGKRELGEKINYEIMLKNKTCWIWRRYKTGTYTCHRRRL